MQCRALDPRRPPVLDSPPAPARNGVAQEQRLQGVSRARARHRTITLLRFISEPGLREEITAATNKVEAYNGFSAWLRFGHDAIERNDPAEQEKIIKFNSLLANCVIFHTALDMTAVLRQLADEGRDITPPRPRWHLSPYITERIKRFGEYATDGLTIPPAAFNPRFELAARAGERTEPAQTASARRAA
jgi:hypothetical protein